MVLNLLCENTWIDVNLNALRMLTRSAWTKFKCVLMVSEIRQEWVPHVHRFWGDLNNACLSLREAILCLSARVPPAGSLMQSPVAKDCLKEGVLVLKTLISTWQGWVFGL